MKKLIVAAVALLVSISSFAQFGIVAGLTSSSSSVKEAYLNYKNINQFHAGITYKLGVGNVLAIQPSLIYNMKGADFEEVVAGKSIDLQYKTGFIELPVQLQVGAGIGSLVRIYGIAEPFVGYAVSNKIEIAGSVSDTWDNVKSKFEYGIGLGLGVEVFRHLQVSARYFWNIGDVYGVTLQSLQKTIAETKCNGITASVAFLF